MILKGQKIIGQANTKLHLLFGFKSLAGNDLPTGTFSYKQILPNDILPGVYNSPLYSLLVC